MKFDELENIWSTQQPINVPARDPAELKRSVVAQLKRRSRMFAYEFVCLVLGLLIVPLLAITNFLYARPNNLGLYAINVLLVLMVLAALLVSTIRRHHRHRALLRTNTETIAAFLTTSLANIDAEMHDLRAARWGIVIWVALALLSIYSNQPIAQLGWAPFTLRAVIVLFFGLLIGWALTRHYRKNLEPERDRLKHLLQSY